MEGKLLSRQKATAPHNLKVGDVLYASWGYEQTIVDFYQVVEVDTDRTIRVRAICENPTQTYKSGGTTVPQINVFKDAEILTRRVNGQYQAVKIDSVRTARKWHGAAISWSDWH
jgi:hypothetical protein